MRRSSLFDQPLVLLLALLLGPPRLPHAQKRPISEKDLFDFTGSATRSLRPTAERGLRPNHRRSRPHGYQTSIYLLDLSTAAARPQLLAAGTHDSSPRWNGNGSQLAFLRAVEKDGKPTSPQVYFVDILPRITAPRRVTDLPKGALSFQWNPNGAVLAVLSLTPKDPAEKPQGRARRRRARLGHPHHRPRGLPLKRRGLPRYQAGPAALRGSRSQRQHRGSRAHAADQSPLRHPGLCWPQQLDRLHRAPSRRSRIRRALLPTLPAQRHLRLRPAAAFAAATAAAEARHGSGPLPGRHHRG